jgi:RNA polymerase sigma-32 factor
MRYRGYGLPIAEILSEGNIGLMQAVKRFDPDRGVRLATYAMWWIRATIQEYILRSWSLVKIAASASQKKLFFKLRRAKSAISALQDGDLRPEQVRLIAERLKVAERDVVTMDRRLRGDVSLNVPIHDEDEAGQSLDWLVDPAPTSEITLVEEQETKHRRQALANALANLNPRERNIFTARWLNEESATLEELAAEHGVSRERVRQIEQRAFQKVKAAMLTSRHEADGPPSSRAKEMTQREARS